MPAFVKSRLGSFSGTSDALGTTVWSRTRKKSRKPSRIWSPVTSGLVPAPSGSGNRRRPDGSRLAEEFLDDPTTRRKAALPPSLRLAEQVGDDALRKTAREQETPRPRHRASFAEAARSCQRPPRPLALG